MKKLTALLLVLCLVLSAAFALADELTFSTGDAAGVYYGFGNVIARYITEKTGLAVTVEASRGSADNIDRLNPAAAAAQLGFVQNDVASWAVDGIRLYEDDPVDYISAIAALYTESVQLVTCDPEIRSVADLKGRNVSIGAQGSGGYFNAVDFLAAYGLTVDDITPTYQSFSDSVDALKDGRIDAAFVVAGVPTPAITELAAGRDVFLVALDEEHVAKLKEMSPAYTESIIPAGSYNKQDADVLTVGIKATIVANTQVTDEQAYTIVKTVFEGREELTASHAKGAELNLEYASVCGIAYHPGAAKYFAEQGITVETAR